MLIIFQKKIASNCNAFTASEWGIMTLLLLLASFLKLDKYLTLNGLLRFCIDKLNYYGAKRTGWSSDSDLWTELSLAPTTTGYAMCNLHASGDVLWEGCYWGGLKCKNCAQTGWKMRLQEPADGCVFQGTAHYKAKLFVYCLSNFFFFFFQARREQNRLQCSNCSPAWQRNCGWMG